MEARTSESPSRHEGQVTTFLADIFCNLADDPSWPWHVWNPSEGTEDEEVIIHGGSRNEIHCRMDHIDDEYKERGDFIAQSPLNIARLDINPDHYAKVKERVEEAKDA